MQNKTLIILGATLVAFGWHVEAQTNDTIWSKPLVLRQGDLQIQVELTSNEHFWPNNYPRTASYLDGFFKIKLADPGELGRLLSPEDYSKQIAP